MIGFEFCRQKSIEYVCHYVMDTLMASFFANINLNINMPAQQKKRKQPLLPS